MPVNLLSKTWTDLDSSELRLILDKRIGMPGQFDGRDENPNKVYLPLARESCRIALTYAGGRIVAIEPGLAFDLSEWERVSEEIEKSILIGPVKVGREYSFSSFRVMGSWRGDRSGVQILPPPSDAPRAHVEMAAHPFILEFLIQASDFWPVTNHRRMREHRNLTLLLNVLLAGRTSLQLRRLEHFWAIIPRDNDRPNRKGFQRVWQSLWSRRSRNASETEDEFKWVQQFFFAKLGDAVSNELSPPAAEQLEELEPEQYYTTVGNDGKGLRVPVDLDESICCYRALSVVNRAKFDRATFWIDIASRQWNTSVSASFAALVSAIESLTERGKIHQIECPTCGERLPHEVPGATRRFKDFFDAYAPGAALSKRRDKMYSLRSGILHGNELMQRDQDQAFGVTPPEWNQDELHNELWGLTRVALRNWLRTPPAP